MSKETSIYYILLTYSILNEYVNDVFIKATRLDIITLNDLWENDNLEFIYSYKIGNVKYVIIKEKKGNIFRYLYFLDYDDCYDIFNEFERNFTELNLDNRLKSYTLKMTDEDYLDIVEVCDRHISFLRNKQICFLDSANENYEYLLMKYNLSLVNNGI